MRSPHRTFAGLVLVVVASMGAPAAAQDAAPPRAAVSQAGYYRFQFGDAEVIALSDGTVGLDPKLLHASESMVRERLRDGFESTPIVTSVNAYLIKTAGRLVLVDTGTAGLFGPTLGKLPAVLRSIGVEPGRITDILITHVHTDHSGGLMAGEQRVYPNAAIHIDRREVAYWLSPAERTKAPDAAKMFFDQAAAALGPYLQSGQVREFDGAAELLPGIRAVPAPGHTPGHTFYELASRGRKLMFWGDVLHVAAVQFADPKITIQYDVSPRDAAAQREKAFAEAAREGYLVAPAHVNFPGIGRIRKEGAGYRWYPAPYANDGDFPHRSPLR